MRPLSTARRNLTRSLRKRMTPQEVMLWRELRLLKSQGLHFRRQAPIGPYIVDFACTSRRIVIEIDGGQHAEDVHSAADTVRDAWLASAGFFVLRFWNAEIHGALGDTVDDIVRTSLARPARTSQSHNGEG